MTTVVVIAVSAFVTVPISLTVPAIPAVLPIDPPFDVAFAKAVGTIAVDYALTNDAVVLPDGGAGVGRLALRLRGARGHQARREENRSDTHARSPSNLSHRAFALDRG